MKRTFLAATCLLGAALPSQASAGPYADTLGRCAIQATSTEDRAALTRWIFIAASSNPALADLVTIPAAAREQSSRAVARLVNRILLEGCRRETVAAVQHEGQAAIQGAFQALGQMAGIEMMAAPEAQAALRGLDGYLDAEGLEALGREAMIRPGA